MSAFVVNCIAAGCRRLVLALVFALQMGLLLAAGRAQADDPLADRLNTARDLAGTDMARARAALASLREDARRQGRPDLRLAADEVECRLLQEGDMPEAVRLATAGLASVGTPPPAALRLPWLRLQACLATALIDGGDAPAGTRVLDEVLAASADPAVQPARALATLQRGVHRSRSGDLLQGQQDLLAACDLLKAPGLERDLNLCLSHLANHYKRMGDLAEAARLLTRLRDAARSRGALYDDGFYTLGLAQVLHGRGEWEQALGEFSQAIRLAVLARDPSGEVYAVQGVARTLLRMNRAVAGLVYIERALRLLQQHPDKKHVMFCKLVHAQLLTQAGRAADAAARLREIEPVVRGLGEDLMLSDWLEAQAAAQSGLGQWREAYAAQEDWKRINRRVQAQRISEQAARLRMQYNRQRDEEDLLALRQLNEQGRRLQQTQAVAIGLFVLLLLISLGYALRKFRQARHLQRLAATDELTGLPNRRALSAFAETRVQQARRSGGTMSVLMIDVDRFKRINDTHGHAVGDEVLRHLAQVLPTGLRSQDRLGRLGGEEFLVVLPGAAMPQAVQVADRMRATIAETPLVSTVGRLSYTVSIGVAELGRSAESVAALLARADAALYRAKDNGRNIVVVADEQVEAEVMAEGVV